jgi:hypothetical protein
MDDGGITPESPAVIASIATVVRPLGWPEVVDRGGNKVPREDDAGYRSLWLVTRH